MGDDGMTAYAPLYARRMPKSSGKPLNRRAKTYIFAGVVIAAVVVASAGLLLLTQQDNGSSGKPIVLYVNQGNGVVNQSNFSSVLSIAKSHNFNTIFFQVYRRGILLFTPGELQLFVRNAHSDGLRIFFALYFTDSSQRIPESIYGFGEDGISLDMSTLPVSSQSSLLTTLQTDYHDGLTAITTTDFNTRLRPNLLVLETYGIQDQRFIHHGIIAGVGVFATTSKEDYRQQFQYALKNGDGVMVFDYAGLVKSGY